MVLPIPSPGLLLPNLWSVCECMQNGFHTQNNTEAKHGKWEYLTGKAHVYIKS